MTMRSVRQAQDRFVKREPWLRGLLFAEGDGGDGGTGGGGGTGDGGTQTTATTTQATTPTQAKDWREGIPADLAESAKNFKHPFDAVKSARDLRQKLSNAIHPLGDKATDDEKAEHQKRVRAFNGVPDKADGYKIANPENLPEGVDPERLKAGQAKFAAKMHAAGAPPAAVQAAVDWLWESLGEVEGENLTRREKAKEMSDKALRDHWGSAHDGKMELAQRAIRDYGGEQAAKWLNATGLGNARWLADALSDLGAYRSEDGMISGTTRSEGKSLIAEADELMASADYFRNQKSQTRVSEIYRQVYGTGGPDAAGNYS